MRMKDKIAVFTSAGNLCGNAIALAFAAEGAHIVILDQDQQRMKAVADQVRATAGSRLLTLPIDVTKKAEVSSMVDRVVAELTRIDVLVNCTEPFQAQGFLTMAAKDFNRCIDVGLKAYFLTSQIVGRQMAKQGVGKIINLISVSARLGSGEAVGSCSAWSGVDSMTRAIAQALGYYGIGVNAIAHGPMEVDPYSGTEAAERRRRIPFGRLQNPRDVVGAAIFLATKESNFIAGETLFVDGGFSTAAVTEEQFRPEWARADKTERDPRTDR